VQVQDIPLRGVHSSGQATLLLLRWILTHHGFVTTFQQHL
jgi:hypothetical protein